MTDPVSERPSALKRRARRPLHEAARSAYASTLGDAQREAGAVGRSPASRGRHADHVFGGQTWLDVLSQMGGCPCEFVDCWNLTINQRLQAAISPRLVCHAGASTPSS